MAYNDAMMPSKALIVLAAVAALGACARNAPPAPLSMPGQQATKSPPPALSPQMHLPHPDQVVVGQGDTVYTIARRYDLPERSIIDANHLQPPYRLNAGSTLSLPQDRFHVVQPGDTLYGVSRLYGVDVSTLASINHLTAPYAIKVGQSLYLPASVEPGDRSTQVLAAKPPAEQSPAEKAAAAELPPEEKPASERPPGEKPAGENPPGEKPQEQRKAVAAAPSAPASAAAPAARAGKQSFTWPVKGRVIGKYGTNAGGTHNDGINIAVRAGEPIHAADGGVVAYAGNELRGYGNLVLIKHPGGYMTAYAHNSSLLVKRGDLVTRGQEIAKAGSTGTVNSPQLHFEIRQGTRALDPSTYLPSTS